VATGPLALDRNPRVEEASKPRARKLLKDGGATQRPASLLSEQQVKRCSRAVRRAALAFAILAKPIAAFLFLGPSAWARPSLAKAGPSRSFSLSERRAVHTPTSDMSAVSWRITWRQRFSARRGPYVDSEEGGFPHRGRPPAPP